MLQKCVNYLNDPKLVIQIQEYFGVRYSSTNSKKEFRDDFKHKNNVTPLSRVNSNRTLEENKKNSPGVKRNLSDVSTSSNGSSENEQSADSDVDSPPCVVTNKFWYYLFVISTAFGDEIFYASAIPFWFWNIDGAVGRRVVLVWTIIMYIGQGIKDIMKMPRPGPPVQKLQKKWALEYGMPSTHAMVGVAIPFSMLFYTMHRYQYSFITGLSIATTWCGLICLSRLYLGMHSVLDIVAGLALAVFLMVPLVPIVDALDWFLLTNQWSPLLVLFVSILVIVYYPNSDKWTPTRTDVPNLWRTVQKLINKHRYDMTNK